MGGNSKSSTDYEFLTVWRGAGTPHEVMDILGARGQEALALELRRRRPGADLSKISRSAPLTFAGRYRNPRSTTHA